MPPEITFEKVDDQLYTILEYLDTNHGNISLKEEPLIKVALETLEMIDSSPKVEFIKEQLSLMCCKPNGRRYSKETLAMAVMWHSVSPACYRLILGYDILCLPCVRHIQRLCSALTVDLDSWLIQQWLILKQECPNWHHKISWSISSWTNCTVCRPRNSTRESFSGLKTTKSQNLY